ncbi:MAG: acireductone synthase, partial [Synechococcaceae cyanobacterium]|nr:acireductone synthase [Synechococcaceae cyanobacterium]
MLLDIEGTTCPVAFVSGELFPYAREHLGAYLDQHGQAPGMRELLESVRQAWRAEQDPSAPPCDQEENTALPYLQWLIRQDRKFPPLKELQGRVWEAGYAAGDLRPRLFADVRPALEAWRARGITLGVYSSGSVTAQQLLYRHAEGGDLRGLFRYWFDTTTGSKTQPESYQRILEVMGIRPGNVLFVSDSLAELQAAA